jgi:germination protein M
MKERSLKIALVTAWALIVLIAGGLGLRLLNNLLAPIDRTAAPVPLAPPPKPEAREIAVYFADENAMGLVAEQRSVQLGTGTAPDAAVIVAELVKGPQSAKLLPTMPTDTRLLGAYRLGNTLILDFSRELQTNHPGGSTGELLTVYSIVDTMTKNMKGVQYVQILVEGEEVETLAGHLDLTKPIAPKMKWMAT